MRRLQVYDKDGLQPAASHAVLTAVGRRIQALALAC